MPSSSLFLWVDLIHSGGRQIRATPRPLPLVAIVGASHPSEAHGMKFCWLANPFLPSPVTMALAMCSVIPGAPLSMPELPTVVPLRSGRQEIESQGIDCINNRCKPNSISPPLPTAPMATKITLTLSNAIPVVVSERRRLLQDQDPIPVYASVVAPPRLPIGEKPGPAPFSCAMRVGCGIASLEEGVLIAVMFPEKRIKAVRLAPSVPARGLDPISLFSLNK